VIALFPSGEPLRVTITAKWADSRTGALLGFGQDKPGSMFGIVVLESGSVASISTSEFTIDWRYEAETDRWVDLNVPRTDQ